MKVVIEMLKEILIIENSKEPVEKIKYQDNNNEIIVTTQHCVEEYWRIIDQEGNETFKTMIFPLNDKKNYQTAEWILKYQFFDAPKVKGHDGKIHIDYQKRFNIEPLITINIEAEKNIKQKEKLPTCHPPKTKILTKIKKNSSN